MLGYGVIGYNYTNQMPSMMQALGYHTAMVGKNHFFPPNDTHGYQSTLLYDGITDEFDNYDGWFALLMPQHDPQATGLSFNDLRARPFAYPIGLHPTTWTGENAVSFIQNYSDDAPLFMKVSFHRPHSPYDPPEPWYSKYDPREMPWPIRSEWSKGFGVRYTEDPPCGQPSTDDWGWDCWCGDFGYEQAAESRRGYYGSVAYMDYQMGRVIDAIKARGWYNDSLMIFISDHGDMLNDHFLWRKGYPWQSSAHVPFIVTWPSQIPAGSFHDHVVELRDVLPTVLDAAGVENASAIYKLDGNSVLALARGEKNVPWRAFIDLEHDIVYDDYIHWNALTDGMWKYVYMAMNGTEQLFHLEEDPNEMYNLAGLPKYSPMLELWRQRLVDWLAPRGTDWVKDGKLVQRPQSMLYSPNWPGNPFASSLASLA